jgi:hypothetical protein
MSNEFLENLALVAEIAALAEGNVTIDELEAMAEADDKQHNPFRRWKKLGDKSPSGRKGPDEKGDWECNKTSKYAQKCVGVGPDTEGQVKHINIDSGYKKKYNHDYKTGQSSGKYSPASRSGGKKKKAKSKKAA